jgi:hypothetical protein
MNVLVSILLFNTLQRWFSMQMSLIDYWLPTKIRQVLMHACVGD